MQRSEVGRRTAGAAVAVVVGLAGGLIGAVAPAYADPPPVREHSTSPFDSSPIKTVTASCPRPSWVLGAGGHITGGGGDVVLTRVAPNEGMHTVTVEARARTPYPVLFSVTAYAVCLFTNFEPHRVIGYPAPGAPFATASCLGESRLFGFGFALDGADHRHLTAIVPDPELTSVEVRTGGTGPPAGLVAYGICYVPQFGVTPVPPHRADETSTSVGWPKFAMKVAQLGWAFGAGGSVSGPANAHLDSLALSANLRTAGIRASLSGSQATLAATRSIMDDDGGATVHALLSGTFE